jgi:hypothetical protein
MNNDILMPLLEPLEAPERLEHLEWLEVKEYFVVVYLKNELLRALNDEKWRPVEDFEYKEKKINF